MKISPTKKLDDYETFNDDPQFVDKFDLKKMATNKGITNLLVSYDNKEILNVHISNFQIRAALFFMVDYWAVYVEQQDQGFKNKAGAETKQKGKMEDQDRKSKQLGIWN